MGDQREQWRSCFRSSERSDANGGLVRHSLLHFGCVCVVEWLAREITR